MKRLLEFTTCRGILNTYLGSLGKPNSPDLPWGKYITDKCITTNIRPFQNPEHLDQILNLIKLIKSRKLATIATKHKESNPKLYAECQRAGTIIENVKFDGYIIEVSSLKHGSHNGPKFTEAEFYKILDEIERETAGVPTLWMTHANVIFSEKYISNFIEENSKGYHDKVILNRQIKSRVMVDKYVRQWAGSTRQVIYPYDTFKSIPGEDVFRSPGDWGHYNKQSDNLIKECIINNIKTYFKI